MLNNFIKNIYSSSVQELWWGGKIWKKNIEFLMTKVQK